MRTRAATGNRRNRPGGAICRCGDLSEVYRLTASNTISRSRTICALTAHSILPPAGRETLSGRWAGLKFSCGSWMRSGAGGVLRTLAAGSSFAYGGGKEIFPAPNYPLRRIAELMERENAGPMVNFTCWNEGTEGASFEPDEMETRLSRSGPQGVRHQPRPVTAGSSAPERRAACR